MWHRLLRYRWSAEWAELRFLLSRRIAEGGSVLDIGAHRGVYSYWMHRHFSVAQVVAFEPQLELIEHLRKFKTAFKLNRLEIAPLGLSSRSGVQRIHRPLGQSGAATFDEFWSDDAVREVFDVPVTTLDEFMLQRPALRPVRFIKCDVAFHEAEVFAGAERILREDRPELLVEWSTPRRTYRERLYELLQNAGYAVFQFEYGRLVPCTAAERHSPPSWELGANYVCLPREAAMSAAA